MINWGYLHTEQLIKIIPFISFISFFIFLTKRKNGVAKRMPVYSPEEEYKKRNKAVFIKSFQELENKKKYSENVDPVFYKREEYNKIMAEADNILEPTWKRRILYEFTPRGNVIMFYDAYKEGFAYYSDTQMTYEILNSAAIKYSISFRCRDFFIDEQLYPDGSTISPLIKLKEDQDKKQIPKKLALEGPFIKSKKSKQGPISESVAKMYSKNKFVHLGKICNFSFLKKESVIKPIIETDYSSIFQGEKNAQRRVFDYRKFKELKSLG